MAQVVLPYALTTVADLLIGNILNYTTSILHNIAENKGELVFLLLVLLFYLVPGQPPNLRQTVLSSSSASISWRVPATTNPHNPLLMYTLLLNEHRFGLPIVSVHVNSSVTSYTFMELEEFNTYTCMVHAINAVGTGLASSISFTTQEDGMYCKTQLLMFCIIRNNSFILSSSCKFATESSGKCSQLNIHLPLLDASTIN